MLLFDVTRKTFAVAAQYPAKHHIASPTALMRPTQLGGLQTPLMQPAYRFIHRTGRDGRAPTTSETPHTSDDIIDPFVPGSKLPNAMPSGLRGVMKTVGNSERSSVCDIDIRVAQFREDFKGYELDMNTIRVAMLQGEFKPPPPPPLL